MPRARVAACVIGGLLFALTPSNYVAYHSVHSGLHNGQSRGQIQEMTGQLRYGSDFVKKNPAAVGSSRPFYYVKVRPGENLAYLRHSLE